MYSDNKGLARAQTVEFALQGNTAVRYSRFLSSREPPVEFIAEAGFCSLVTAQLFTYLRANSLHQVRQGANKLFIYQTAHLDLDRFTLEGEVGTSMFDLTLVTPLVAALDPLEIQNVAGQISAANHTVKQMDSKHVLVVLEGSGNTAIQKAADLAKRVKVTTWMPFEEWQALQATEAARLRDSACIWRCPTVSLPSYPKLQASWVSRWLVICGAGLAMVLVAQCKAQATTVSRIIRV